MLSLQLALFVAQSAAAWWQVEAGVKCGVSGGGALNWPGVSDWQARFISWLCNGLFVGQELAHSAGRRVKEGPRGAKSSSISWTIYLNIYF